MLHKHCVCIARLGASWDIGIESVYLPYPDKINWVPQPRVLYTCTDAEVGVLPGTFKSNRDMPMALKFFQDTAQQLSTFLSWIFNFFFFSQQSTNPFFSDQLSSCPSLFTDLFPRFLKWRMEKNWGQVLMMHKETRLESSLFLFFFLLLFCPTSHFWLFRYYWDEQIFKVIYSRVLETRTKIAVITAFLLLAELFFSTLFCRVQVFSEASLSMIMVFSSTE